MREGKTTLGVDDESVDEVLTRKQSPHLETIRRMVAPEYHTLGEIGAACTPPITRERVRQIIAAHSIQRAPRPGPLPWDVCGDCGRPSWAMVYSRQLCPSCRSARSIVTTTCANAECGKKIRRRYDQIFQGKLGERRLAWCSRECWGVYAGTHYGFSIHGNRRYGSQARRRTGNKDEV